MKTCEALAKAGIEVNLLIPERENYIKKDIFSFYGVERIFTVEYLSGFDFRKWEWWFKKGWFLLERLAVLYRLKKKKWEEGNIIYTREAEIAWVMAKKGLPVCYEAHTKPRWWKLHLWLVRQTVGIIAISRGLAGEYEAANFFSKRVVVIPDGVDLEKFNLLVGEQELKFKIREELGLSAKKKIILYAGSFQKWKGVDCLIEAINELKVNPSEIQDKFYGVKLKIELVLAGNGPEEENLRLKVNKLRLRDEVVFMGFVERSKIPELMIAADVLVLPNSGKEKISRVYTSPLKMFEYMAAGVPIVASDLPSIREVLNEEMAVLVKADDAGVMKRGIEKVLAGGREIEAMVKKNKELVKKYTWRRRAEGILCFINERKN